MVRVLVHCSNQDPFIVPVRRSMRVSDLLEEVRLRTLDFDFQEQLSGLAIRRNRGALDLDDLVCDVVEHDEELVAVAAGPVQRHCALRSRPRCGSFRSRSRSRCARRSRPECRRTRFGEPLCRRPCAAALPDAPSAHRQRRLERSRSPSLVWLSPAREPAREEKLQEPRRRQEQPPSRAPRQEQPPSKAPKLEQPPSKAPKLEVYTWEDEAPRPTICAAFWMQGGGGSFLCVDAYRAEELSHELSTAGWLLDHLGPQNVQIDDEHKPELFQRTLGGRGLHYTVGSCELMPRVPRTVAVGLGPNKKVRMKAVKLALALTLHCLLQQPADGWLPEELLEHVRSSQSRPLSKLPQSAGGCWAPEAAQPSCAGKPSGAPQSCRKDDRSRAQKNVEGDSRQPGQQRRWQSAAPSQKQGACFPPPKRLDATSGQEAPSPQGGMEAGQPEKGMVQAVHRATQSQGSIVALLREKSRGKGKPDVTAAPLEVGLATFTQRLPLWLQARRLEALRRDAGRDFDGSHFWRYTRQPKIVERGNSWKPAFHGTWWTLLWSILKEGVLLESKDDEAGHEFWQPGVYVTPNFETAFHYARSQCLFDDGIYHRVLLEVSYDPKAVLRERQKGGGQIVLPSTAVCIEGVHFLPNRPPKKGEERLDGSHAVLESIPLGEQPPTAEPKETLKVVWKSSTAK